MPGVVTVVSALAADHSATGAEIEPESDVASDKFHLYTNRLFSVGILKHQPLSILVWKRPLFSLAIYIGELRCFSYTVDRISESSVA